MTASQRPVRRPTPPARRMAHSVGLPHVSVNPGDDGPAWAEETFAALSALATLQARALELAYRHRLTHREIADQLGVTVGEVATAVAQGLCRLGEAITANPEQPSR